MKRLSILCTLFAATVFGSLSAQTVDTLEISATT